MKINDEEKEISEINMTPFVDIILVVLIIFMATATFMVEGKIPLDLPKAKTGEAGKNIERIEISIKKDGSIYITDKKVSPEELKQELEKIKSENKVVALRSEKETPFQNVVTVIDICRSVGIEKYVIETKKE